MNPTDVKSCDWTSVGGRTFMFIQPINTSDVMDEASRRRQGLLGPSRFLQTVPSPAGPLAATRIPLWTGVPFPQHLLVHTWDRRDLRSFPVPASDSQGGLIETCVRRLQRWRFRCSQVDLQLVAERHNLRFGWKQAPRRSRCLSGPRKDSRNVRRVRSLPFTKVKQGADIVTTRGVCILGPRESVHGSHAEEPKLRAVQILA